MSTDPQSGVLATIERMTSAFHAGDLDGIMATYEQPATIMFEPGAPVSNSAAIREMFRGSFQVKPHFEFSAHEVFVAGDVALHFTPWKMTGTAPDGTKVEQRGLSVAVLRKQTDGRWLMVIDNPHGQRLLDVPGYPK